MDHRCPECGASLARRKLVHAVLARMEIDCDHCKRRIGLNIHKLESAVVMANFAVVLVLGALAYWYRTQELMLWTLGAALFAGVAVPLLERTVLRDWPRYARLGQAAGG
ncbi:MAG: hypothetical protein O3A06_12225 [Proteobacteria bacterium]|nr:hypothetical protein [Pseudomonadota bacterium]MDA0983765.1 hypothetical protein [Pseudomonadota bacterium]